MGNHREDFKLQFHRALLAKRQVWLHDVYEEEATRICASIHLLNVQGEGGISLYIDSDGGDATDGLKIYNAVRLSRAPVTGIVIGSANSIASVILQGCSERKAARHSLIAVHTMSRRASERPQMVLPDGEHPHGQIDLESIVRGWELTSRIQASLVKIYAERTKRPPVEIVTALNEGKTFTAEEAKRFGLVDEVL